MVIPQNTWLLGVDLLVKPGFEVPVGSFLTQVPELLGRLIYRFFQFTGPLLPPKACRLGSQLIGDLFYGVIWFHIHHVHSLKR